MGFDDWFKKKFKDLHEAICCGDLVASNYKKAIKKGFNAGAASQQGEIDELQKQIDDALLYIRDNDNFGLRCMSDVKGILKGKKDE